MPLIKIAVIIPVRNRKNYTQNILNQLHEQESKLKKAVSFLIIVVDDNPSDGTPIFIKKNFPEVHVVEGDGNLWWTGAIRVGMEYALDCFAPDYFLWLNNDIQLDVQTLDVLYNSCKYLEKNVHSKCKPLIGGIIVVENDDWIAFSGRKSGKSIRYLEQFTESDFISVDVLNGNLVLIPREVVEIIGYPDVKHFRHYGGDYDYSSRAREAGIDVLLSRKLKALTEYSANDVIRYMPFDVQFYLASSLKKRWNVFKNLTNLKSNYNIWHNVNLVNRHQTVSFRTYWSWYYQKIKEAFLLLRRGKQFAYIKIKKYFEEEQIPHFLQQDILQILDRE